ncbi:hypothetical protein GGI07_002251 [Coemansia sp. Benny D115]|nr:hypothetical protein GGI07_002251 [Coemansia sp. Benny D115]
MIDRVGVSSGIKRKCGATLRHSWLDKCAQHIEQELNQQQALASPASSQLPLEAQIRLVYEQLLNSEISESCTPALAVNPTTDTVSEMTSTPPGTFLQIQEIMDIGVSKHAMWEALKEKEDFEQRGIRPSYLPATTQEQEDNDVYTNATQSTQGPRSTQPATQAGAQTGGSDEREPKIPRSMLKLTLTDGKARIPAIEMAPILHQLHVELPIGTKVLVTPAQQILEPTGTLCLHPASIRVLGGRPPQYAQYTLRKRLEKLLKIEQPRA